MGTFQCVRLLLFVLSISFQVSWHNWCRERVLQNVYAVPITVQTTLFNVLESPLAARPTTSDFELIAFTAPISSANLHFISKYWKGACHFVELKGMLHHSCDHFVRALKLDLYKSKQHCPASHSVELMNLKFEK